MPPSDQQAKSADNALIPSARRPKLTTQNRYLEYILLNQGQVGKPNRLGCGHILYTQQVLRIFSVGISRNIRGNKAELELYGGVKVIFFAYEDGAIEGIH